MTKKENVLFVLNLMFSQWMDCPLQHPGTHLFRKAVIPLKLEHIHWPSSLKRTTSTKVCQSQTTVSTFHMILQRFQPRQPHNTQNLIGLGANP